MQQEIHPPQSAQLVLAVCVRAWTSVVCQSYSLVPAHYLQTVGDNNSSQLPSLAASALVKRLPCPARADRITTLELSPASSAASPSTTRPFNLHSSRTRLRRASRQDTTSIEHDSATRLADRLSGGLSQLDTAAWDIDTCQGPVLGLALGVRTLASRVHHALWESTDLRPGPY